MLYDNVICLRKFLPHQKHPVKLIPYEYYIPLTRIYIVCGRLTFTVVYVNLKYHKSSPGQHRIIVLIDTSLLLINGYLWQIVTDVGTCTINIKHYFQIIICEWEVQIFINSCLDFWLLISKFVRYIWFCPTLYFLYWIYHVYVFLYMWFTLRLFPMCLKIRRRTFILETVVSNSNSRI